MKPSQDALESLERLLLQKGEAPKKREISEELASLLTNLPKQPPQSGAPGHDQFMQIQQKIKDLKDKMIQKQKELLQEAGREENAWRDLSRPKK